MNIYDKGSEAFKNYTPSPDAEKAWKNSMKMTGVILVSIFLSIGTTIARPIHPNFLISYRGTLLLTFLVILVSIFAIPFFNFQNRSLMNLQPLHDYFFIIYKKAPISESSHLLTIASLNIIMGNTDSARFAYELVDASSLKPKSMPVYERVKAYMESDDSASGKTYSMKDLMPGMYRRLKLSKFIVNFAIVCDILLVAQIVYLTVFYLPIFLK